VVVVDAVNQSVASSSLPAWASDASNAQVVSISALGSIASALSPRGNLTKWATDGGAVRIPVPDRVQGRAITAISFGGFHDVVLTTGGFVDVWMAWAAANLHGLETIPSSLTAGGVKAVAAGYAHILALTAA
jgi:hypothetical protein